MAESLGHSDTLCPFVTKEYPFSTSCLCGHNARVRADERERGAVVHMDEMDNMGADLLVAIRDLDAMRIQRDAARVMVERAGRMALADLRAKVEVLRNEARSTERINSYTRVLALIDEAME